MRRLTGILGVAALVLLPGCSEDTITATPDDGAETTEAGTQSEQPAEATIGDTISLHGELDPELEIAVTVESVVDPAKGDRFLKAEEGNRYAAVEVRLQNTGPIDCSASPTNGAVSSTPNSTTRGLALELSRASMEPCGSPPEMNA